MQNTPESHVCGIITTNKHPTKPVDKVARYPAGKGLDNGRRRVRTGGALDQQRNGGINQNQSDSLATLASDKGHRLRLGHR